MSRWPFEWLWIREGQKSSLRDGGRGKEGGREGARKGKVKGPVFCILAAGVVWEHRPV